MGFLTKTVSAKSGTTNGSAITIIAEGNKFSGDMSIVGKMHIDGAFEGNISSLDNISIGKMVMYMGLLKPTTLPYAGC